MQRTTGTASPLSNNNSTLLLQVDLLTYSFWHPTHQTTAPPSMILLTSGRLMALHSLSHHYPISSDLTDSPPLESKSQMATHLNLDPATHLLLSHQQSLLPPNESHENPLDFDHLMQGFKKWPKHTMTLPSSWHLGIYKSLLKDQPPSNPLPDYEPHMHGIDIMQYVYWLLKLALQHMHAYEWWKVVWNMYL